MLLYNVFDMSTNATPTRNGRGMPVPGIDTSINEQNKQPTFNQGWPLTPPQSAISNESRRPSLAYSSLSEAASSGPSSICGYSQPATPVSAMHYQEPKQQQWSEYADVSMSNGLSDICSQGQQTQSMFSSAYPTQTTPTYSSTDAFGVAQSPWNNNQQQQLHYQTPSQAGLSTTLFQTTQGLGQESLPTASMYANPNSSVPSPLQASPFGNSYVTTSDASTSMYQPAQVVVPSQVTPHDDYHMEDFSGYNGQEGVNDAFNSSFGSTTSGYSNWEMVGPQSPGDAYFAQSEDDDFINVKDEIPMTPTRSHIYSHLSPHQSRPRRRPSRRGRKSNPEGKAWYESESHGIRMRCEGKRFAVIPNSSSSPSDTSFSLTVVPEETRDTKPHKCHHKDPESGSICGRRFERSEHLKRHQGMHSNERKFPCPLHGCDKRIGRSDNASDHFKTHLKAPSKGRRNKQCSWATLERALVEEYEEKTATKMLTGLGKWFVKHQEEVRVKEEKERRMKEEKERYLARL